MRKARRWLARICEVRSLVLVTPHNCLKIMQKERVTEEVETAHGVRQMSGTFSFAWREWRGRGRGEWKGR